MILVSKERKQTINIKLKIMETINTDTVTAPVVVAETETVTVAVNKTAVIIARKSLIGKWKKPGAPPKEVIGLSKNRKRGAFTKADIFDMNGQTICMLTITKRIKQLRKAGELVKMAEAATLLAIIILRYMIQS